MYSRFQGFRNWNPPKPPPPSEIGTPATSRRFAVEISDGRLIYFCYHKSWKISWKIPLAIKIWKESSLENYKDQANPREWHLGNHVRQIKDTPLKLQGSSQYYLIEGFKWGSSIGSPLCRETLVSRESVVFDRWCFYSLEIQAGNELDFSDVIFWSLSASSLL